MNPQTFLDILNRIATAVETLATAKRNELQRAGKEHELLDRQPKETS